MVGSRRCPLTTPVHSLPAFPVLAALLALPANSTTYSRNWDQESQIWIKDKGGNWSWCGVIDGEAASFESNSGTSAALEACCVFPSTIRKDREDQSASERRFFCS